MSSFPTNVNFDDLDPPAKPDAINVEWQAGIAIPDPNSPGNWVRDESACYRVPQVGGIFIVTDDYQFSDIDSGFTFICNSATPITLTLPQTIPALPLGNGIWTIRIKNAGTGVLTVDPNGLNLDGSGSAVTLDQGYGFDVSTDGTDYWTTGNFGPAVHFVDEVPSGTINGSNASFTLSHAPNPAICLELESDGTALAPTVGYSVSGGVNLTLVYAPAQTLIARYRY